MTQNSRPATGADADWLFSLHQLTMGEHIEQTWGWDEEWQRRDFARRLGCCDVSIIEADGVRAGALWIERLDTLIYLTDLQILPAFQGRGIGSAIVKQLIAEGNRTGRTVELSVLHVNQRARQLYERLGFTVTDEGDPFIRMSFSSA